MRVAAILAGAVRLLLDAPGGPIPPTGANLVLNELTPGGYTARRARMRTGGICRNISPRLPTLSRRANAPVGTPARPVTHRSSVTQVTHGGVAHTREISKGRTNVPVNGTEYP